MYGNLKTLLSTATPVRDWRRGLTGQAVEARWNMLCDYDPLSKYLCQENLSRFADLQNCFQIEGKLKSRKSQKKK